MYIPVNRFPYEQIAHYEPQLTTCIAILMNGVTSD